MKNIIFILILLISFSAAGKNKPVDKDFEEDYKYAIQTVNDCDKYRGSFYDHILAEIYFSMSYLRQLTKIDATCIYADHIPIYQSRRACLKDIRKWKKWYTDNKYNYTKQQSDSIKKLVWSCYIWWQPNDLDDTSFGDYYDLGVQKTHIINDTLLLKIDYNSLLYPFGKTYDMKDILTFFPKNAAVEKTKSSRQNNYDYNIKYKNSEVVFFSAQVFRDVFANIEVVNMKITDKDIKTVNGIEIGMHKKDFFENFSISYIPEYNNIKVVETVSVYKDIQYRYVFDENDSLSKIETYDNYMNGIILNQLYINHI